ncbi:MAG TPA: cytochrome c peroxidase, partial [Planctomycetota bacterium]|nr:cytochrome c peroxidase [Planctomycetota bacterium]
ASFAAWPSAPAAPVVATPAIVALGERLYHETALSKGRDISCASCHSLETFGQDNKPVSSGTSGQFGKRSAPSTFNAFRQFAQFWDGRADSVETQSTMPMMTGVEHGLVSEDQIVDILRAEGDYSDAFARAFQATEGDGITADNVRAAIGAFERTLVTRSPFDAWVEGDDQALNAEQRKGLETFVAVGCTACHATRAVGGQMYQKLGLVEAVPSEDLGRFQVTQNEADRFLFKVPSLLNVAETAPYLHDGRFASLEETVRFMAKVQLGRTLSDEQARSIVAFLGALTGVRS